jgi:hypothetical protein
MEMLIVVKMVNVVKFLVGEKHEITELVKQ